MTNVLQEENRRNKDVTKTETILILTLEPQDGVADDSTTYISGHALGSFETEESCFCLPSPQIGIRRYTCAFLNHFT